ncbi:MAG TPA: MDR family MFS transporter [Clostridia bacterium]|nr:MDR family MFS transporter [Clostridia bacterium]
MEFNKKLLIISLMLAMFLAAVEGTIVTLATPTITRELHGFSLISLVFSMYLLAAAISTPIYGKLADLYGRKKMLSIGILIFLVGSFLCGLSQNIAMLISFRTLQGLGAGSIYTVSYTIIGDVFPIEERAKIQGGLSTVWGVASLVGPLLGGFLIDMLSWHWIFYINIPFGLLAVFLLQKSLVEDFTKQQPEIDYLGASILTIAVILFMSIFLFDHASTPGNGWLIVLSVVVSSLLLILFYRVEKNAREPIVSFEIFTIKTTIVNLVSFLLFAVLMGFDVYLPIYLQNVLGHTPTISGLTLLPSSISWLIISFYLGKLLLKYGDKTVTVGSVVVIVISMALLPTLGITSPIVLVATYGFVVGLGFGGASTALTIIIQDSVGYSKRGIAMGANSLSRALGQTIGISIFGNVFNSGIVKYFNKQNITGINPADLYQSTPAQSILTSEQVILSLNSSLHTLFLVFFAVACISLLLAIFMPKQEEG